VQFEEPGAPILAPERSDVVAAFNNEVARLIDREIYEQVERLQRNIASSGGDPRFVNRLGVLYARYGRVDEAAEQFARVLARDPRDTAALVNLGNLSLLQGELDEAYGLYEQALQYGRDPRPALVGLARTSHALGDYRALSRWFDQLENDHPETAERFADLSPDAAGARASGAITSESLLWDEEEP
jgi:tetratricopeptide (TPR) repeat protein